MGRPVSPKIPTMVMTVKESWFRVLVSSSSPKVLLYGGYTTVTPSRTRVVYRSRWGTGFSWVVWGRVLPRLVDPLSGLTWFLIGSLLCPSFIVLWGLYNLYSWVLFVGDYQHCFLSLFSFPGPSRKDLPATYINRGHEDGNPSLYVFTSRSHRPIDQSTTG